MIKLQLKIARHNSGLKIEQVAEEIGVHPYTIYKWENEKGEPSISQALKMCELYGCDIHDIKWKQFDKKEKKDVEKKIVINVDKNKEKEVEGYEEFD